MPIVPTIARFIDCRLPIEACNLRCHYCYITMHRKFSNKPPAAKYSPEHIGKALSRERLGGVCCVNICGAGETFLSPQIVGVAKSILEQGHYLMIVNNGLLGGRIRQLLELPEESLDRLMFKFSYQFLELERRGLHESFFRNVSTVRNSPCSFTVELTPSDECIPYIERIKRLCMENVGAWCHVTVARDTTKPDVPILTGLTRENYAKTWGQFNSVLFDYKLSVFNRKIEEYCHAGDWTGVLDLGSGELKQCYKNESLMNIFEDIDRPIPFKPVGMHCGLPHCFNAHAWLTFGAVPELDAPCYAAVRNRTTAQGDEWLKPKMKEFLSVKLGGISRANATAGE